MKLSPRDRRSLLVLGVFLLGAAFYVGYLDPLQARVRRQAESVRARRQEVWKLENKLRELRSWREDHERLRRRVDAWRAALRLPGVGTPLPEVLRAMGRAAAAAGVEVSSLRPMPRLLADDTTQVIDTFIIEGHATVADFDRLLWELQGMAVSELTLARGETAESKPRFHLRAALLSQETIARLATATAAGVDAPFTLGGDLFVPKPSPASSAAGPSPDAPPPAPVPPPPAEPPAPAPEVPAPPPRPALALRGVAEIAGKQVAVLTDTTTGIDLFLLRGEAHGEWVLQTLDAGGVTLQTLDRQQTARLDLPEAVEPRVVAGPSAAAPAANREPAPAGLPAAAHLGVSLTQLTVADAAARFGEGSGTLLVTGVSRPDSLLQAGDLICELGGIQVAATEEVMAVLRALHPGAEVTLRVQRQRETVTVTLKLL